MSDERRTVTDITIYPWVTPADPSPIRDAVAKGEMNAEQRMARLKGTLVESLKKAGVRDDQLEEFGDGFRVSQPTKHQVEVASNLPFVHKPKTFRL